MKLNFTGVVDRFCRRLFTIEQGLIARCDETAEKSGLGMNRNPSFDRSAHASRATHLIASRVRAVRKLSEHYANTLGFKFVAVDEKSQHLSDRSHVRCLRLKDNAKRNSGLALSLSPCRVIIGSTLSLVRARTGYIYTGKEQGSLVFTHSFATSSSNHSLDSTCGVTI